MRLASSALFAFAWIALLCGCGDDAAGSGGAGAAATTGAGGGAVSSSGAGGAGSGGAPVGTTPLVSSDWVLEPGTEIYQCTRFTVPEDLYITEFHPVIPLGTHHTVLTLQPPGQPDGTTICGDPFEGGPQQLYGTGVGSLPMRLPPGVAVKVAAGQQLHLNLHLFNAGTTPLEGTSRIDVVTTTPDAIEHEADLHIWGQGELDIAPNDTTVATGTCTLASAATLFIVQPHMHQLGKHLTLRHAQGSVVTTLFDDAYSFDAQVHLELDPHVALSPGDQLSIECTFENPTSATVTFGESSNDEMCLAGLWMYPAGLPLCLQAP